MNVIITAYSSTIQETDESPFLTASGSYVKEGVAANNLLPFGTRIRIPEIYGDKIFIVEDRLNPRVGFYHVDIWFPSHQEAETFGAQRTYIEILEY
jgi:3D (Asp-Asp-Asp) domain-containing protein